MRYTVLMAALFGTTANASDCGKTYVFGGYVLDIAKHLEAYVPGREIGITSCDTNELYCLRSSNEQLGVANIVVPKTCSMVHTGDKWTASGVTMVVKLTQDGLELGIAGPVAIVQAEKNNGTWFYYSPKFGIIGLGSGAIPSDRRGQQPTGARIQRRITFDPLFACS